MPSTWEEICQINKAGNVVYPSIFELMDSYTNTTTLFLWKYVSHLFRNVSPSDGITIYTNIKGLQQDNRFIYIALPYNYYERRLHEKYVYLFNTCFIILRIEIDPKIVSALERSAYSELPNTYGPYALQRAIINGHKDVPRQFAKFEDIMKVKLDFDDKQNFLKFNKQIETCRII